MTESGARDDDVVPVSVRLGEVVPPEDPEDWTRPLTWVAALGMLLAPIAAVAWFAVVPPAQGVRPEAGTMLVALAVAAGAAATGATQQGTAHAAAATLAAGLFSGLAVVIAGVVLAGERQVGVASPTLAHAFTAAAAGAGGAIAGSVAAAVAARILGRPARFVAALLASVVAAWVVLGALLPS